MEIQPANACCAYSYMTISSHRKHALTNNPANFSVSTVNNADKVNISQAARNFLVTQSNSVTASGGGATALLDTDQGAKELNIDDYFSTGGSADGTGFSAHSLPPLLLPTRNNIEALAQRVSSVFPKFLAQNNIPSAPASITYDSQGQVQFPSDYAYASELKQALADNPTMAKELKTVHALSSHMVEIEKSASFHQEYISAATQSEVEAVINKYSYLFAANRRYSTIALHFSQIGSLSITADGNPL